MLPIIMVSCGFRTKPRDATLSQFRALGHHPDVYLDPCGVPSPAAVRKSAWQAVSPYAGRAVLYIEDDVDINPKSFNRMLTMVMEHDRITSLCLLRHALLPAGEVPERAKRLPVQILPLNDYAARRGFHGTMAVYLPSDVTHRLGASQNEFMLTNGDIIPEADGFDFWLKTIAADHGGMFTIIPNPVNHRPGYSTWGRQDQWQDFQSTTYQAEPTWRT